MTTADAAKLLDLVLAKAPALRAIGVLELGIEGLTIKLAPVAADFGDIPDAGPDETEEPNMWNDPRMYGRARGIPGKPRSSDRKP